jgi:NAD(P)H dehydrogenase (quinone)
MRILLVFAHPTRNSFCGSILRVAVEELASQQHEVEVLDLYAEGFNPTLLKSEWESYRTSVCEEIRRYADQIHRSDGLIWIFPTWNYGLPAIMKGYLDRVWKPNVAFQIEESGKIKFDSFKNLRFFIVATTYGASWVASTFVGNPCKCLVSRCLRRHLPSSSGFVWLALYDMNKPSPRRLNLFLAKVRRTIRHYPARFASASL